MAKLPSLDDKVYLLVNRLEDEAAKSEALKTLAKLGVETVGQFAGYSKDALASQGLPNKIVSQLEAALLNNYKIDLSPEGQPGLDNGIIFNGNTLTYNGKDINIANCRLPRDEIVSIINGYDPSRKQDSIKELAETLGRKPEVIRRYVDMLGLKPEETMSKPNGPGPRSPYNVRC